MKQFGVILAAMLLAISLAFADGTKQFMPNAGTEADPYPKGTCYLDIGAREGGTQPSRPFARFSNQKVVKDKNNVIIATYPKLPADETSLGKKDSVSCPADHRLHIRIVDHTTEYIHFGFGAQIQGEGSSDQVLPNGDKYRKPKYYPDNGDSPLTYRIKNPKGEIVKYEEAVPRSSGDDGFIETYKEAYLGPSSIASGGYDYIELDPEMNGDYYIEFYNGDDIGGTSKNAMSLEYFDVTVVKKEGTTYTPIEGRVWSKAWGLNTNYKTNKTYTSFYTMSTDLYLSKVYLDGFEPYRFVIACNSYGSVNTGNCEEDRKSMKPDAAPYNDIPEYQVFLTKPDPEYWGKAKIPNVPDKLTFAGDAMTCEDLIFVVQLLYNENATLELYMDTDQDGITDKVIAALLQANVIKDRGFHYPWKDKTELKNAGQGKYFYNPAAEGCARRYTLSLFDQTYTYPYIKYVNEEPFLTTDRVNPGDSLQAVPKLNSSTEEYEFLNKVLDDPEEETVPGDWTTISFTYPIGSEQNPVLITETDDLENLLTAVNKGQDFSKCIENFYHYWNDEGEQNEDYCYTIRNSGENEGFRNTYFYIVVPTGTIELEGWEGIGAYSEDPANTFNRPFRGHIRAGHYQPNPTDELTNATNARFAGDQDTIIIHGSNGLFAYCDGATIENIHVKGDITGVNGTYMGDPYEETTYGGLGGICDHAVNTSFSHCSNSCSVKASNSTYTDIALGGIIGYGINCSIDSCSNYTSIINANNTGTAVAGTGGIVGYLGDGVIDFCYNVGAIKDPLHAGGIVGYADRDESVISVSNCKNEGYVESGDYAGGIIGLGDNGSKQDIFACHNKGYIYGKWSSSIHHCGGILGGIRNGESTTISYCINEGEVNSDGGYCGISPNHKNNYKQCISLSTKEYIDGTGTGTVWGDEVEDIDESNIAGIYGEIVFDETENDESPFYLDLDGNLKMFTTECCGRTFHQEDAGRLFNSNTTFYIKWDGKNSDGECVTGDVVVNYQKNSGVTHFPFYDPEYNRKAHGLVVYRISPIQDTITNVAPRKVLMRKDDKEEWIAESNVTDSTTNGWEPVDVDPKPAHQTAYQAANGITDPSYYGYINLPKDYFGNTDTIHEKGIELKLFWDDTKISLNGNCTDDGVISVPNGDPAGYIFGETISSSGVFESRCTGYKTKSGKKTVSMCQAGYEKSSLDAPSIKYCTKFTYTYGGSNLNKCTAWSTVKTANGSTNCFGISNLGSSDVWEKEPNASKSDKTGGYYGSTGGGHMFPMDNFGNGNTMNTWWNGVEVKQLVPLKLTAYEPAILMAVELTKWTATNLEESVLLEWTTASEENNDYFAIERSIDGVTWKVLGNVGGAGTTSTTHYYSFEDTKPVSGISYYRLKQVDYNGEYTYSSVKCINRPANADKMYKAYVNKDIDAFIVQGEEIAACNIEVYNTLGIKMTNLSFNPISTDKVVINVGQLPIGTYFIKICNGSKSVVKSW